MSNDNWFIISRVCYKCHLKNLVSNKNRPQAIPLIKSESNRNVSSQIWNRVLRHVYTEHFSHIFNQSSFLHRPYKGWWFTAWWCRDCTAGCSTITAVKVTAKMLASWEHGSTSQLHGSPISVQFSLYSTTFLFGEAVHQSIWIGSSICPLKDQVTPPQLWYCSSTGTNVRLLHHYLSLMNMWLMCNATKWILKLATASMLAILDSLSNQKIWSYQVKQ